MRICRLRRRIIAKNPVSEPRVSPNPDTQVRNSWCGPIAEFSIEKDDRTMVSYQRH
ncbi:hypothetical protein [Microcoleus sp.]|uniref:hypothetical protein n=1 Tax=Microcoleus sp. TaxID=44472 RepID=UPI0035942A4A